MTLKYKADLFYYKEMYESALKIYEDILILLPITHSQVNKLLILDPQTPLNKHSNLVAHFWVRWSVTNYNQTPPSSLEKSIS